MLLCVPHLMKRFEQIRFLGLDSPRCNRAIIQYCTVMSGFAGEMSSLPNTSTAMDNLCSHQMYIPNAAIGNDGLRVSTLTAALFLQGPGHG